MSDEISKPPNADTRLGLRCEAMILLGILWILIAVGIEAGASNIPADQILAVLSTEVRSFLWLATGVFAIISGLLSDGTKWALVGLTIMPTLRIGSYLYSYILYIIPGFQYGELMHGWYFAVLHSIILMFVMFIAHIPPGTLRTNNSPDLERLMNSGSV